MRLALQVLTAGALAVSAYLHVDLAQGYDLIGEQMTMGDLFLAQAAVAGLAALALLVRPARLTWALAALVGFGSLAGVVLREDRLSRGRRTRRSRRHRRVPDAPPRPPSAATGQDLTGGRTDTDHRRSSHRRRCCSART